MLLVTICVLIIGMCLACCCGVTGFDCLSGQISHHYLPPEDWWETRFPCLEQPAHPICWVSDARWVYRRRPCQCGVHAGTRLNTGSQLLSILSNPSVFFLFPCMFVQSGRQVWHWGGSGMLCSTSSGCRSTNFLQSWYKKPSLYLRRGWANAPLKSGMQSGLSRLMSTSFEWEGELLSLSIYLSRF